MVKTATEVKVLNDAEGDQRLYRLSEPVGYDDWDDDKDEAVTKTTDHVVVSAAVLNSDHIGGRNPDGSWKMTRLETYIFPADENGIVSWCEIGGSRRCTLQHSEALAGLGYVIAAAERRSDEKGD